MPATLPDGPASDSRTELEVTASVNVATTVVEVATPVALAAGALAASAGDTVSTACVLNTTSTQ